MRCPLFTIGYYASPNADDFGDTALDCIEEECAWYQTIKTDNGDIVGCAVPAIGWLINALIVERRKQ